MKESMFTGMAGFARGGPWFQRPVGPTVFHMTREEVDRDRARVLRRLPVPPGVALQFPYVVKIEGEGEYVVRADGTAVFYSARAGRWEPPQIVDNRSPFAVQGGER